MQFATTRSLSVLLTLLSLSRAASRGPGGPSHRPNCPYQSVLAGKTRVFNCLWYDPSDLIESNGGYRIYTENHFFDDFTITDNTANYLSPVTGTKLPPPSKYARSRLEFTDIHSWVIPEVEKIFCKPRTNDNYAGGGDIDENDCLTHRWNHRLLATLQQPYG